MNDRVMNDYYSKSIKAHCRAVKKLNKNQQQKLGKPAVLKSPKISVQVSSKIPKLAWLCQIVGRWYKFTVGTSVEVFDKFIFEGVWDGSFSKQAIDESDCAYGSGALCKKCVIFVPPKHCWEYLFVLHDKEKCITYVSNSMNFIFSQLKMQIHGDFYNELLKSLKTKNDEATSLGIDLYDQLVLETTRFRFYRMMFYNFTVNSKGQFKLFPSLPQKLFNGFHDYKAFLLDKMDKLIINGMDPSRKRILYPLTLISRGYDSPCVAALAARLGYLRAATIDIFVKGKYDSGKEIAEKLGMKVDVVKHVLGYNVPELATEYPEYRVEEIAEFIATPGNGDDIMLKSFENHLKDSIYLSGTMGDSIWKRNSKLNPGLPVGIIYGKSITEFRLRTGFAFVPIPALGARFAWPIKRMTKSKEMEAFTLHQPYDRPFPRRIVEEAGISRGSFAEAKAATNPTMIRPQKGRFKPNINTAVNICI